MQIREHNRTQLSAALSRQVRADDSDFRVFWFNIDKEALSQTIRKENDSISLLNKLSRVMELCVLGAGTVAGAQVYEAVSEGSAAHPIFIVVEAIVPIMVVGGLASAEYIRKNATLLIKSGTDKIASAFLLRITNY